MYITRVAIFRWHWMYLTLPSEWSGCYTCPALRPYHFGPMSIPECNHKVTGDGYEAVDGCEAINGREAETT